MPPQTFLGISVIHACLLFLNLKECLWEISVRQLSKKVFLAFQHTRRQKSICIKLKTGCSYQLFPNRG